MPKLVVGPIDKGLRTDRLAFNIDNDSFPTLVNAYQWRGRIKRKRGTEFLGRLTRFFNSSSKSYSSIATINLSGGAANILTGFSLQASGNIVPGSVVITDMTASPNQIYTDPGLLGILVGSLGGAGTVNYATGAITISGGASDTISVQFLYTPDLPVMGLRDLILPPAVFPGTLAFDPTYSYNILTTSPYSIYDVSFYKNPMADPINLPGYVPKTVVTPTSWNGQDYQQFWTTNYQGALWATNGINVPFNITNIGMQYKLITAITINSAGPPGLATLTIAAHGLVQGDFVFINEVVGITGINFQTGYVVSANPQAANTIQVEFPNATLGGAYSSGGIAQYLTNRSDVTKDCIRWYDGDPTNGSGTAPVFENGFGWVNFAPPLSQAIYPIADLPAAEYYLIGAKMIVPFKDRLLFLGPVIQTSAVGSQKYLQDTVIYSQNGTPYYTASFTPLNSGTYPNGPYSSFGSILVPINQTGAPDAYFEDQTGYGGFISAGLQQPIQTVGNNEDVLIIGFSNKQTRLAYSGNDILPFNFFSINSELGSSSTFSSITLDRGILTVGSNGIIMTQQIAAQRIDLSIPDQIFEFNLLSNGFQRVCSQRDFINEWIYFTYPSNTVEYIYPNQTLQYNYREDTWAIFNESYTTYGTFKRLTGETWASIGISFPTWNSWDAPWDDGEATLLQPQVIAGNQQGFVMIRITETSEGNSLYVENIVGITITSPNHCLNDGDFIIITGAIGVTNVNGIIFQVQPIDENTFTVRTEPPQPVPTGTYLGGGLIKRMYVPYIQTKQFPVSWELARKTRLGVQQYLLSKTDNGQITLLIFLSMYDTNPYNLPPIVPSDNVTNNSLVYNTTLYTSPEPLNLNMVTGGQQSQIWHRMNTSLIGDTVQLGFTISDTQMFDPTFSNQFVEIELHGFILDVTPSQLLA